MSAYQAVASWVERLDPVADLELLRGHGLQFVHLERRDRHAGNELDGLRRERSAYHRAQLGLRATLARIREVHDGPMILLKGLDVADRYPHPWVRPIGDLDVLAAMPDRLHRQLLAAGFVPMATDPGFRFDRHHHLQPLIWPALDVVVEVHRRAGGPAMSRMPDYFGLRRLVTESVAGPGWLTPVPAAQAVLLAAHAWQDNPLAKARDLLDIALFLEGTDPDLAADLARRWRVSRLWRLTQDAVGSALTGEAADSRRSVLTRQVLPALRPAQELAVARRLASCLAADSVGASAQQLVASSSALLAPRWGESRWRKAKRVLATR